MSESDPTGRGPHDPGAKLDAGKPCAGILLEFSRALLSVSELGTYGIRKYARGSWKHVPDAKTRYTDALLRHLLKRDIEPIDPDTGLSHAVAVAWNALALLELEEEK